MIQVREAHIEPMWVDDTDDFEYVPMSDIRIKFWTKRYPTWYDRCGQLFDTHFPDTKTIVKWKDTWVRSENRVFTDIPRGMVFDQTKSLGIHPYFWQYVTYDETHRYQDTDTGIWTDASRQVRGVVFYYDEDFIMYKLKHG